MGVRDGGTRVDLNDQAIDIIDLRTIYNSGPKEIHIAEVIKRLMNNSSYDDEFKILFTLFCWELYYVPQVQYTLIHCIFIY